jgi:hypothetical protein
MLLQAVVQTTLLPAVGKILRLFDAVLVDEEVQSARRDSEAMKVACCSDAFVYGWLRCLCCRSLQKQQTEITLRKLLNTLNMYVRVTVGRVNTARLLDMCGNHG